jgi:hypothetical protein
VEHHIGKLKVAFGMMNFAKYIAHIAYVRNAGIYLVGQQNIAPNAEDE